MKKVVLGTGLLLALMTGLFAFTAPVAENTDPEPEVAIKWMSWEEAMTAMEENPKKIFIDVYTDWCGWCKRMDATTFKDPTVAAYISENYYAVKLDAEQRAKIVYDGHTFNFDSKYGRRGAHELQVR